MKQGFISQLYLSMTMRFFLVIWSKFVIDKCREEKRGYISYESSTYILKILFISQSKDDSSEKLEIILVLYVYYVPLSLCPLEYSLVLEEPCE
jgi:hypothetical protein